MITTSLTLVAFGPGLALAEARIANNHNEVMARAPSLTQPSPSSSNSRPRRPREPEMTWRNRTTIPTRVGQYLAVTALMACCILSDGDWKNGKCQSPAPLQNPPGQTVAPPVITAPRAPGGDTLG
jgi:hypothetical protein